MRAGLDSKENSFCAREAAHRHRDRLVGWQGHGEEDHARGPCRAPWEQRVSGRPWLRWPALPLAHTLRPVQSLAGPSSAPLMRYTLHVHWVRGERLRHHHVQPFVGDIG